MAATTVGGYAIEEVALRLVTVHICNYKCVLDSGVFSLGDLTCFVGKNESGKTAILEAVEKINSVRPSRADFKDTDFPRMLGEQDDDHENVITARFQLSVDEFQALKQLAGPSAAGISSDTFTFTRGYNNKGKWEQTWDHRAAVTALLEASNLPAAEKEQQADVTTTLELVQRMKALTDPSPHQQVFLSELNERFSGGTLSSMITGYLTLLLPKFVYYSQYDNLPGRVSLDELIVLKQQGSLGNRDGLAVFIALMSMVNLSPDAVTTATEWEPLIGRLETVSTTTSRRIFKYWSQNKNLKVRFGVHQGRPGDPAPYNVGTVFETRIENLRHGASIRLDERSTGFIWFFSFFVWFAEVQREFGDNLVVLLDEPGLSLHAKAQSDLLRYIKDELLTKYQVAYSTHSPFMIDAGNLISARTVEDVSAPDGDVLGTKVGDQILSADGDTLFALRAALGYEISQTLFVGEHTLLVEGPSDLLYLQWASEHLRQAKRTFLDPRWTVTPAGGIAKIQSFLALFGGNKLHVAVLTDFGTGDKAKVRDLRASDLLRSGHVFTANDFADPDNADEGDVEDILGRSFYVDLINAAYGLKAANKLPAFKPNEAPARVTVEVADRFKTMSATVDEYNHYAPADYLATHPDAVSGAHLDEALDRFERLFEELNKLL